MRNPDKNPEASSAGILTKSGGAEPGCAVGHLSHINGRLQPQQQTEVLPFIFCSSGGVFLPREKGGELNAFC